MLYLRSMFYSLVVVAYTPVFCTLCLLLAFLPRRSRYRVITGWAHTVIPLAQLLCGVSHRVEGIEHLPERPAVIMSNHRSAWETIAFQLIFPPQVYVLKRELLWVPFFGWALALMSPIAINRSRGTSALREVVRIGIQRLAAGFWVVVFPEGTRVRPGEQRKFKLGGAMLAVEAGAPIVPVAHNAGAMWPPSNFPIRSGLITVRIGPAIETRGRDPQQVNADVQAWIESQLATLEAAPAGGT